MKEELEPSWVYVRPGRYGDGGLPLNSNWGCRRLPLIRTSTEEIFYVRTIVLSFGSPSLLSNLKEEVKTLSGIQCNSLQRTLKRQKQNGEVSRRFSPVCRQLGGVALRRAKQRAAHYHYLSYSNISDLVNVSFSSHYSILYVCISVKY